MSKNTPSNDALKEITSVCTNYQELIKSKDFKRVIQIAIKQSPFKKEAIMSIFRKLGKGEELLEQEQANLTSFVDNENVEKTLRRIHQELSTSSVDVKIENPSQLTDFGEFLEGIFSENGFEATSSGILEQAGIDVSERVSDAIILSSEALEVQKKFNNWLADNQAYATKHKIGENVKVTNDGIQLGGETLYWSGHQFGGVSVEGAGLGKQPYTIQQMGTMIQALGGKALQLKGAYTLGGSEISSFLSEVTNIELGNFYWSSSLLVNYVDRARGVLVNSDGVSVHWFPRSNVLSSLSSQN